MKKEIDALVVVAHPDDETIWMGGTILKNKDWNWTILSLCRKGDPDRMPKFKKVCENYGAVGIISDLDDEILKPLSIDEVKTKILESLKEKDFDYVFTHGENGEYGHLRHKETHNAMKELVGEGNLRCNEIRFFSYELGNKSVPKIPKLKIPIPRKKSDWSVVLDNSELKKKKQIVTKLYGFESDSFEALSCKGREHFLSLSF
jgi:LmbE family N-acetylglucosaminyl deacetylase